MSEKQQLRIGLPKGSLQNSTVELFRKAGFSVTVDERAYSPDLGDDDLWGVLLRAQELPEYIAHGVLDCGLTGYDWILERNVDVVEVCDLLYAKGGMRPYKWVLAVHENSGIDDWQGLQGKRIATELVDVTRRFLAERGVLPGAWSPPACPGQSLIYVAVDGELLALLAAVDQPRSDAAAAVDALHRMGVKTIMLTGDRRQVAAEIANQIGIDDIRAELLPSDKTLIVQDIQKTEKAIVAMVGDGINDAPAMSQADVGIAIGAGADVAIESADIVLTGRQLMDVAAAIALCRATLGVIQQNLFWAFAFNAAGIPLASGVFTALFGGPSLRPVFAALAMACSSLVVIGNAPRLRRWRPPQP